MRRMSAVLAVAALSLVLGLGATAYAQTPTSVTGIPSGQGGHANNTTPTQHGGAPPGGRDNPAVDAGPARATDDDSSIAPWLIGAAVLVVLVAGAAFVVRRAAANREPSYSA